MKPKILPKPRVLVVDDDPEFAQLVEYNLAQRGCDILIARDGLQGLRTARAELPDVILLDVMLPDIEGLTVCEILRAQPSTRDIPVFILSALHESWAATRKSKARFAHYFQKPVDLKLLGETVFSAGEELRARMRLRLADDLD
jgi:DNA-binding response OmpR family regulator